MSYVSPNAKANQKAAISAAIAQIEQLFSGNPRPPVIKDTTPTGSLGLDCILGGGWPSAGIVDLYGNAGTGKTTLALSSIERAQKSGKNCAYIDMERTFDATYAASLGVDIDNLIVAEPTTGEEALEIAYILAGSGAVQLIVMDSVAAMVPKMELETEMGAERVMNVLSRMLSKALIKLKPLCEKLKCLLLFVNQTRFRIIESHLNGGQRITPGGAAIKSYARVRVDMTQGERTEKDNTYVSACAKVVANKATQMKGKVFFQIDFGSGINRPLELLDMSLIEDLITLTDEGYHFHGDSIGTDKQQTLEWLKQNTQASIELWKKVRACRLTRNPLEALVKTPAKVKDLDEHIAGMKGTAMAFLEVEPLRPSD